VKKTAKSALNLTEKIITPAAHFTQENATEGTTKQNKPSNLQWVNKQK